MEEKFCPAPFTTLIINPNGKVGCCREKTADHYIGDLNNETLMEIWNNHKIREWRKEFLENNIKTCKTEIEHRKCNIKSYNQFILPHTIKEEVQKGTFLRLAPGLSSSCNLKCRMCYLWQIDEPIDFEEKFWKNADKNIFPYLEAVDLLSGEPFIQKETYRLIDEITKINKECIWRFTTNGHWKMTSDIKAKLDKINNIYSISISLDSIDKDNYRKIRQNGDLEVVLKNIEDIIQYKEERKNQGRSFDFEINMTVQQMNWREVPEIFAFSRKNSADIITIQNLYSPPELSLLELNQEERVGIIEHYLEEIKDIDFIFCGRIVNPLLESFDIDLQNSYRKKVLRKIVNGQNEISGTKSSDK